MQINEGPVVSVYTDGACSGNPGNGGWSAIINGDKDRVCNVGYDEDTTNNRMELMGFISGLEMIHADSIVNPKSRYIIYTDSRYIENPINLKWLNKWIANGFDKIKNVDLWVRISELLFYSNIEIKVVWVPREKNADADQMAKQARDYIYGKRATLVL